jgi:hypothetical protein
MNKFKKYLVGMAPSPTPLQVIFCRISSCHIVRINNKLEDREVVTMAVLAGGRSR